MDKNISLLLKCVLEYRHMLVTSFKREFKWYIVSSAGFIRKKLNACSYPFYENQKYNIFKSFNSSYG